jgi:flagellar biosynthesis chaperone FliJ
MAEDHERSESPSDGFDDLHEAYDHLRASIQELAIEFRFLTAEVKRLKQHLQQLAQYAISERNKRQEATASRDRIMRAFMNRLSTAVDEFNTQLSAVEVNPEVEPNE